MGVAAGIGVVATLIGFSTARVTRERDKAQLEAVKAAQVATFLTSVFEVANPEESRGLVVTAKELLDRGAARVTTELAAQPEVQGAMRVAGRRALTSGPGPGDARTVEITNRLIDLYQRSGRQALADSLRRELPVAR